MRASELKELIVAFVRAGKHLLVASAPGNGKSQIAQDAVAEMGDVDLIVTHPAIEDPTDSKGLPAIHDGVADFIPFGALRRARAARRRTVWFADDLGQATPAVQSAYMPLMDATRGHNDLLGEGAEHVVFIAATNRRTDRAGVTGVLEPVKSRFAAIVELEAHVDDWCGWALDNGIPAEVIAFLRFKPQLLSAFVASADLVNSPSPRTWSHAAAVLAMNLTPTVQAAAMAGAIGEGAAAEFLAFVKLFRELPNVDAILLDPDHGDVPTQPATLYALSGALAYRANAQNFSRIAKYADRLKDAQRAEFAVLMIRDAIRKDKTLTATAAFVKLATTELGQLICGR